MEPELRDLLDQIRNEGWMVRHYYSRGARTSIGRLHRQQALIKFGLTCRYALNHSNEFEAILSAIVEALSPKNHEPF